jgi:glutamine cyclotransferase
MQHVIGKFRKKYKLVIVVFLIAILQSCRNGGQNNNQIGESDLRTTGKSKDLLYLESPMNGSSIVPGEEVMISFSLKDSLDVLDSIVIQKNGNAWEKLYSPPFNVAWKTKGMNPGEVRFKAIAYYNDSITEKESFLVTMLSDVVPVEYTYKIVNVFPHDRNAYTQGLYYEDGYIYEGTGQYTRSTLRKTKLETGELINSVNLPDDVFGEGITVFNDKIIQVTWKARLGFIYDKQDLSLIRKINYPISQGWGITYDGNYFYMSDGSNTIYKLDTEYFSELDRIEVFTNKGKAGFLNELEYINGNILANVYGEDHVLVIDPLTGKVLGRINLKGLLQAGDRDKNTDVLNGVAYNPENDHLYVTGKNWPKLFEIELFSPLP